MKEFVRLVERMHRENYVALHERLVSTQEPCAIASASTVEATKKFIERLRAEGLNIARLFMLDDARDVGVALPPPHHEIFMSDNIEVCGLSEIASSRPMPHFVFVDMELDYKFAAHFLDGLDVTILKPPLKLDTTRNALDAFFSHIAAFHELYVALIDDESRRAFEGYWLARATRKFDELHITPTPHYVCRGFTPKPGDIVIDGGACDGSTAAWFADMGCKVYAFEMDQRNYELAAPLARQKNFIVENLGLGAFNHQMKFSRNPQDIGCSTLTKDGTEIADIVSLDSYVLEHQLPRVDFIKLDIEGSEFDMLKGAATSIARWKPILAISAYHKLDDFWKLSELVRSICPDYEFAMRHYIISEPDTPYFFGARTKKLLAEYGLTFEMGTIAECVLLAR